MKAIFLIVSTACFLGCHSKRNTPDAVTKSDHTDSPVSVIDKPDSSHTANRPDGLHQANIQENNKIDVLFAEGSDSLSVKGHLDSIGASVTCYIPINAGQKINAKVDGLKQPANIRFNRILFPDGKSDGPFGKELNYAATQKGIYKLEIASNLMAEDAYSGDFVVRLQIK